MARAVAEVESYGMGPDRLRQAILDAVASHAYSVSPHLTPAIGIDVSGSPLGILGTPTTSATLTVDAPTLDAFRLNFLVGEALNDTADSHKHGEYEFSPEAFRYSLVTSD